MAVPASADELERFTPRSLANLPVPPVFLLRPASEEDFRDYQYLLIERGCRSYTVDDFRAEALKAVEHLYDAESAATAREKMESHWALLDQGGKPDPVEAEHFRVFEERLVDNWEMLAIMRSRAAKSLEEANRAAACMFIMGWSGLSTPYSREMGAVPPTKIAALQRELIELEERGAADKTEGVAKPGTAFMELCAAAFMRMAVSRDEEKNSSSPPSSARTRNGSTRKPSRRTGARKSKASASSGSRAA